MLNLIKHHESIKTPGERLSFLRGLCSITRKEFSSRSNLNYTTIKHWENVNQGSLKIEAAEKIVKTFESLGVNCTTRWLLHGGDEPPFFLKTANQVDSNITTFVNDSVCNSFKEVDFFKKINPNSTFLIITDTSMGPLFEAEDIVAGIKKTGSEILIKAVNKICIVETTNGIKLLRKVDKGKTLTTFDLNTINMESPYFPKLAEVSLIYAAPVIWHRKKDL